MEDVKKDNKRQLIMLMIGSPVIAALLTDSPIVLHANDGMLVPPVMFRAVAVLRDPGLGR